MSASDFAALGLDVEQPARMTIMHPVTEAPLRDHEGNAAYIDVYSSDSDRQRKHERTITNRRFRQMQGMRVKMTAEQREEEALDLLAALTAGWRLLALDGSALDIPFSPEAARSLYANPATAWLREQVNEFAADRGNFSRASSTS